MHSFNTSNVHVRSSNIAWRSGGALWWQTVLPALVARDEVDLFWSPAHRIPCFLSNKITSAVTIHDLVWKHCGSTMQPLNKWLDALSMPAAINRSDQVICVSNSTANDVATLIPGVKNKLNVIHLGCNSLEFKVNNLNDELLTINEPYFIFVGTIEPRKNLERLLKAFSLLNEDLRNRALFLIVGGNGWGDISLNSLIESLNLNRRVHVLGRVDDGQLSSLYKKALFVAMPSLYEGFGLPLVEAMQFGVPSLTSNCSSMPEIVGNSGELVNPYDIDSISRGLSRLLSSPNYLNELGINALDRSRLFSWDIAAEKTLKIFESSIQNKIYKV
jgi:glycosyltransferase involved in cell wall biosynthesis